VAFHPGWLNASITAEGDMFAVASLNNVKSAIFAIHLVHCGQDSKVFNIFHMSVRVGVDVRVKPA
jgi:hypothetical protein